MICSLPLFIAEINTNIIPTYFEEVYNLISFFEILFITDMLPLSITTTVNKMFSVDLNVYEKKQNR